jgi:inosine-uridine nucleoside N-ribohydrolase
MRFLLDGDPGHDDMLTLFLAAKHVEVVGLTTTYGNSSVEHTTLNARKCLERGGPDRLNRIPRRLSGLPPGLVLCNFARGA